MHLSQQMGVCGGAGETTTIFLQRQTLDSYLPFFSLFSLCNQIKVLYRCSILFSEGEHVHSLALSLLLTLSLSPSSACPHPYPIPSEPPSTSFLR